MRIALSVFLVAVLMAAAVPVRAASTDEQEIRLGQSYARQVERKYKVVTGSPAERVARVGADIARVADRPQLPYTYKVIQLDIANAFSLPGGYIYITTGMLKFLRSDHELAAILAHETVHAAHGHQLQQIRRSNQALFITILLAALTQNVGVFYGANLIGGAALSGYSRDIERDADLTGIAYLVKTRYTPVAMLTVMEHLLREERYSAQVSFGDFEDHPEPAERVAYIQADLERRGIPINRRQAANYLRIATRTVTEKPQQIGELLVDDMVVLRLPDPDRIQIISARFDEFFNSDPQPFEVTTRDANDGWGIFGGTRLLFTITSADAAFLGAATASAAATEITARLRWVIDQDNQMRRFKG